MNFKKTARLCLLVAALLVLACAPALAKVVSPGPDFYYLDNANVLSEAVEGEIFFSNKLLYDACGAQIVVVTVKTTGHEAIDDYAYELFNDWGIGDAAKNNGFLLLLAIDDDDYYARTGSGLDSRFSASTIKQYYDQYLEDDFAAKRYEAGVKKFFEAVFERIADTYGAEVTAAEGIAAYEEYVAENAVQQGYGGYNGSRRTGAVNGDYGEYDEDDGRVGLGFIVFLLIVILIIVLASKGRRARRRVGIMPPPPPPPRVIYRPSSGALYRAGYNAGRSAARTVSRSSFSGGGSTSRSSFGSSSSRSSFGSSGGRSSFGGGSRSSGFGGGSGGGGRSSGGGAGRGRH